MRTPETEALLRELLRSHDGLAVAENHTQLACREFLVEHMDILAEEGVKFLYTEMFVNPDHLDSYNGLNYTDTAKQLKNLDFKSALCAAYPGMALEYGEIKELSMDWMERRENIPSDQLAELDALYEAFIKHDYSATKLYECAQRHGITVVGANTSGADRYATMLDGAKKFFAAQADEGKIILHAGSRHLARGGPVNGFCEELCIPLVGAFNGPQQPAAILPNSSLIWNAPNEYPMRHDYIVQGSQSGIPGVTIDYPENYVSDCDVIHGDEVTRTNCSNRVAPLASVSESHTAGIGDGTAEHAQKLRLAEQAAPGVEKF